jgi:hypothetical protein
MQRHGGIRQTKEYIWGAPEYSQDIKETLRSGKYKAVSPAAFMRTDGVVTPSFAFKLKPGVCTAPLADCRQTKSCLSRSDGDGVVRPCKYFARTVGDEDERAYLTATRGSILVKIQRIKRVESAGNRVAAREKRHVLEMLEGVDWALAVDGPRPQSPALPIFMEESGDASVDPTRTSNPVVTMPNDGPRRKKYRSVTGES